MGDRSYGSFSFNREVIAETGVKRMLLHSSETSLKYAFKGKLREFSASSPLPEAFNEVLRFRPGMYLSSKNPKAPVRKVPSKASMLRGRRFRGR